jgi:hypothetical protein
VEDFEADVKTLRKHKSGISLNMLGYPVVGTTRLHRRAEINSYSPAGENPA